jgi:choline dehydrogenase
VPTTVTADGRRSSTSEAFLPAQFVRGNQNLKICFGAIVQRLDIDEENRVRGVYVETEQRSAETYYIKAKEVILCCGAIASPQLLMLRYVIPDVASNSSGIGRKGELEKHNIVCKVDLPGVGAHLVQPFPIYLTI